MDKRLIKIKEKYYSRFLLLGIAYLSMMITTLSMNSACHFLTHQSKLPEKAKKLRKF